MNKKILLSILLFFIFVIPVFSEENVQLRDYIELAIQKGTFFKAINQREISSATYSEGDEVSFIATGDVFIGDINIIPDGSILTGYVEDVRMPVEGINGALKIKINKVTTPDKKEFSINAYVSNGTDIWYGGNLTHPVFYHKIPHFIGSGLPIAVLQYVPDTARYHGLHCVMKAGEEVFIMINGSTNYFQ